MKEYTGAGNWKGINIDQENVMNYIVLSLIFGLVYFAAHQFVRK